VKRDLLLFEHLADARCKNAQTPKKFSGSSLDGHLFERAADRAGGAQPDR
jgi:hypothetical protein